ncbi:hypothetical protein [Roseisolibacter sp. H3M3-2]|uniref:non-homologous end-joining DNA ligase LigD n=1 Tax=Roseisolibacter sp. H3M3-2 TaxID=3031323 RepID=UPI0023DB3A86|nr:hypothetical protein [Roseisolibacter sp. H3M3-2]MDF1504067.1 hypothetical protein [Roseisolibacter sp. H3M3-2]
MLRFPDGRTLPVSHLDRPVWPALGITKGALLAHYVATADAVVPALAGRALVLTRHPAGVGGPSFHQHDPGPDAPDAADVATLPMADGTPARRLVGSLGSLLHAVQLGAVGVDAWHSRVDDHDVPDYAVLDLDPAPDAPTGALANLALLMREQLALRGYDAVLKTSGSRGLHLMVPLDPGTSYDGAAALAEEVAETVAAERPEMATVARSKDDRPPGTVYLDHLQNARGKTLAAAFCARARPDAAISAPLAWDDLVPGRPPVRVPLPEARRRLAALRRSWDAAWAHAAPPGAWRPASRPA